MIVIKNARVMQTRSPFEVIENADIVIEGSVITAVGPGAGDGLKPDKVIDAAGRTVIPGNVCGHHHYYSGLSRGMLISAGPQTDFIQVLKEWWWRLDRGLDEEACYYSSLICSLDAIAAGTTSVIDHHASPSFIDGSLSVIARGIEETGLRGITCYEVTDRNNGMDEVREGVNENVRFAREVDRRRRAGERVMCDAMIGGHAQFTIPDGGLELMGQACEDTGRGAHIHIAEDKYDVVHCHHVHGTDIIDRLDRYGLLRPDTLLVHGLHINSHEVELLNERGCWFAHNGRSNMNNNVGYCSHLTDIRKLIIGTDGCGGNMFEELKIAFFKHKDQGGPWWPADFVAALNRGNDLVSLYFKDAKLGRVEPGYKADLAILDYHNPTPLLAQNAPGHFVWGMNAGCVESVLIDGVPVYENRRFTLVDAQEIYARAAEVAARLWKKVDGIKP